MNVEIPRGNHDDRPCPAPRYQIRYALTGVATTVVATTMVATMLKVSSALFILLIALCLCPAAKGNAPASIQSELLKDIGFLSADDKAGREPETPGHAKAADYLRHRFAALALQPLRQNFSHTFTFTQNLAQKRGTNIIGKISGTTYPEQYIVFTAHYDHLGRQGRRIFNGADDNASGVAVMLAIAAHFNANSPHHSLLFVATDAEESGLHGAHALFDDPVISNQTLLLNINLDMLGNGGRKKILYILSHGIPGAIEDRLAAIPQLKMLAVRLSTNPRRIYRENGRRHHRQDWRQASDHGAFDQAGIPYLFFASDTHSHYHQHSDDIENIRPQFVTDAARAAILVAEYADENMTALLRQPARR
ncbi:M28 family peptidase [Alteromonas sp. H39]|uniref:M28 family peptidase n=1 Tax=Alteromonas sp. H39 TaxID=3389876 RepID=UPI0039E15457